MADRADRYTWYDDDIVFGEDMPLTEDELANLPGEDVIEDEDETTEKSYDLTQSLFLQELRSLVKSAIEREDTIGRYSFSIRMRGLLKRYGEQAYKDGLAQGGVFVDELDPEDESDYRSVFVDQASYVGSFSDDIYVSKAVTLNNLDMRVNAWGKSLQSFVDSGRVNASANAMYEWHMA